MRVAEICGELQPFLGLIIRIDTGGVSSEVRVIDNAAVIKIANAAVIAESVLGAACGKIVLLSERVVESFFVPVVGDVVVFTVGVSKDCLRIEFEVAADEGFSRWNCEDLISESAVVLVEEGGVGKCICLVRTLSCIDLRVVHHPVVSLVIFCRVSDDVVLWDKSGVRSPFCVKTDDCILASGSFGGDEDNSVGATGTVDCTCRSVFQDGHRFDIVRVYVRDRSVERHSVHNDQWRIAGAH